MDSFKINIQYSYQELQAAYSIHYNKVYPIGSRLLLILGLISLVIGIGLLVYSYIAFSFTNWFAWFLIIYSIVLIVFYFWRFKTIGKRMFRKMPDFENPYEYTFSENGIQAASKNVNSDNRWSYYIKYFINSEMILLYPNKFRFNFFARKHFTDEQFALLQKWIKENIPVSNTKNEK
jgi:hypothetical protein